MPYRVNVISTPKPVEEVGTDFVPTFFLPVTLGTIGFIRGMLSYLAYSNFWQGTEEEIQQAIQVIERQISEPIKTASEICGSVSYGADFRILPLDLMQSLQGELLPPPPWEFRLLPQEDGGVLVQYRTMEE